MKKLVGTVGPLVRIGGRRSKALQDLDSMLTDEDRSLELLLDDEDRPTTFTVRLRHPGYPALQAIVTAPVERAVLCRDPALGEGPGLYLGQEERIIHDDGRTPPAVIAAVGQYLQIAWEQAQGGRPVGISLATAVRYRSLVRDFYEAVEAADQDICEYGGRGRRMTQAEYCRSHGLSQDTLHRAIAYVHGSGRA